MDSQRQSVITLFPEINDIKNNDLRERVIDAWLVAVKESPWKRIEDLPWVPGKMEKITNVQHCRGTAIVGKAIAEAILSHPDAVPGADVDVDVVIAGCLLHDVGKLLEYEPSNPSGKKTPLGSRMAHHVLGTYIAIKAGLPDDVVHCIESHRERDPFERSYEAKIVQFSDKMHTDAILKANPGSSIF